ncbi:MAG: hypothetical protein IJ863_01775 [Spirochaetales bacterium]|nr:hypothetical protein [Spirochaetales bacterium]
MKKIAILLLCIIALGLIVSCQATNHGVALSQNKGVVGKNGIPRPDWVIYDQSTKKMHFASGFGTSKTFEVAKQKAVLNADAELALWIANSVTAVRDRYIEEAIVNESETYIDKFVSTATEMGNAVMSGVTEIDYWEDGDGGVWVLRAIEVANVKAQIAAAISATCAEPTLFSGTTDVADVMAKLNKALDEYFPAE